MKEGPDIALIGSMIGDPARANMLTALMSGKALTATELASEAGITVQTASSHLSKLVSATLVNFRKQGRHRYYALADEDVSDVLESLMGLAAKKGHMRLQTGPKDPALRKARICYDHLAGDYGVQLFDSLRQKGLIKGDDENLALTTAGYVFAKDLGVNIESLETQKRPLCKSCLDWSARRTHMAGSFGAALLDLMINKGWAKRETGSRIISFTEAGDAAFQKYFPAHC